MFDSLNNNKEANIESLEEKIKLIKENYKFTLYLLFSKKPKFNISEVKNRIRSISDGNIKIQNTLEKESLSKISGLMEIDGEKFEIEGFNTPVSKEIAKYTVEFAYGKKEELEAMESHSYHISVSYLGKNTDYNVIYNAYAKLAYGFLEDNFVGMANKYAWNTLSKGLLKDLFEDSRIVDMIHTPAMMVWRNFIKIPYNGKVWFVTKGNNLYGVHEYAFKGDSFDDSRQVYDMFEDIFNYEYIEKEEIEAGCTIQLGKDIFLRFRDVYEIENYIQGEGIGTLVLEIITKDEIDL